MSWRLFGQIVLLMIIGAIILGALKCGMLQCHMKYESMVMKDSCMVGQMQESQTKGHVICK